LTLPIVWAGVAIVRRNTWNFSFGKTKLLRQGLQHTGEVVVRANEPVSFYPLAIARVGEAAMQRPLAPRQIVE
jgi:hypothetical protein